MVLADKVVLVTGSSNGIGKETAYAFAKEKCNIVVTYHADEKAAHDVAAACRELGAPDVLVRCLNLLDNESIELCVEEVVRKFERIDILVNNAGIANWKYFKEQTFGEIEIELRTNLEGLLKMTRACLPHIKETIINISSGAGKQGFATLTTYCASKFGVCGFTQASAQELERINVYSVNPGMTATRMTEYEGIPPEKGASIIVNTAKGTYQVKSGGDVDVWEHT